MRYLAGGWRPVSLMIRVSSQVLGTWRRIDRGEDISNANCHYWPAKIWKSGAGCVPGPGDTVAGVFLHPDKEASRLTLFGPEPENAASGYFSSAHSRGPKRWRRGARSMWTWASWHTFCSLRRKSSQDSPMDDPVSPLAAPEISRPELDQLAHHPRRHAHRSDHLPSERWTGRGPVICTGDPHRTRRHVGERLFRPAVPDGRAAMTEAADLVMSGKAREVVQDESQASYEAGAAIRRPRSLAQPHRPRLQPDPGCIPRRCLDHV